MYNIIAGIVYILAVCSNIFFYPRELKRSKTINIKIMYPLQNPTQAYYHLAARGAA